MFVGKGYKLVKSKSNTISYNFGHSHLMFSYFIFNKSLKLSKTKIIVLGLNYFLLKSEVFNFYKHKKLNIFTWRGLRIKKSIKRKKTGKVSLYF